MNEMKKIARMEGEIRLNITEFELEVPTDYFEYKKCIH
jgi:hypothetical protein